MTKFVLFAHPRSGSSNLLRILQLHPGLRIAEEPFHPKYKIWNPSEPSYADLIKDLPSLQYHLAELFEKYNGIKVLDYQLPKSLYTHLLLWKEVKVIRLWRRNILRALVSGFIAEQTGIWKHWDAVGNKSSAYRQLDPIPLDALAQRLEYVKDLRDYYMNVLTEKPHGMCFDITYEDLYLDGSREKRQRLERLFNFLGIDLKAVDTVKLDYYFNPRKAKINDAGTYELLPNSREIDERFGSREHGYLFD